MKTGMQHEGLRNLHGFEAKKEGKRYAAVHNDDFLKYIHEGNRAKIAAYPRQLEAFKANTLPFTHYYVFGSAEWVNGIPTWPENAKVRNADGGDVLICFWEIVKTEYDLESI